MIRPLDGPAQGHTLMLHSAPDFLRITRRGTGKAVKWDALDQPGDTPEPGETIFVYRRASIVRTVHINMGRGARSGSGFYAVADYRHVDIDGERFRDQAEWSKYARTEPFEIPTTEPRRSEGERP